VSARKSLLLVDADTKSLRVLEVSLRKVGFSVGTAASAAEAMQAALTSPPDLVITDTRLPDMDGFELCRRLRRDARTSHAVVVFLTEGASPELKVRGIDVGGDEFLTKPVLVKEIIGRIRVLLERRSSELAQNDRPGSLSGTLANMGVVDLLQVMEAGRKNGVAKIVSDRVRSGGFVEGQREQGLLFFRDGQVVDAEVGRLRGPDAVFRMLLWEDGMFDVEFGSVAREDVIQAPTQDLLLAGLQRVDEWSKYVDSLPPLQARLRADLSALSQRRSAPPREVQDLISLFDGRRTLFEVIAQSPVDDSRALRIVSALNEQGVLRASDEGGEDVEALDAWLKDDPLDEALPSLLEDAMIPSSRTPSEIMSAAEPGQTSQITRQTLPATHAGPIPGAQTQGPESRRRPALKVQKVGGEDSGRIRPSEVTAPAWLPSAAPAPGWTGASPWNEPAAAPSAPEALDLSSARARAGSAPSRAVSPPPPPPSVSEQAARLSEEAPAYSPSEASTFRDDFFNEGGGGSNTTQKVLIGVLGALAVAILLVVLFQGSSSPEGPTAAELEKQAMEKARAELAAETAAREAAAAPADMGPAEGQEETSAEEEAETAATAAALTGQAPPAKERAKPLPRKPAPAPAPAFGGDDGTSPSSTKELLAEARSALESGLYNQAEANYQEVLRRKPEDPAAQAGLAFLYMEQKNDDRALELAEEAIGSNAQSAADAYVVIATLAINKGDKQRAIEAYRSYLAAQPNGRFAEGSRDALRTLEGG
jgi:CheY-like chemotaxis protein